MLDNTALPPLPVDWKEFTDEVGTILRNSSLLSELPIAGDRWEEVLAAVFRRMGFTVHWTAGSHRPGADIQLSRDGYQPVQISVKAGGIKARKNAAGGPNQTVLNFSSYRLTTHPTIEDKIAFIDGDSKEIDWYLFAARKETKQTRTYQIYLAKSSIIQAKNAEWTVTKGGWAGEQPDGVTMKITRNMSDQLWLDIPLSLLTHGVEEISDTVQGALISTIEIPISALGSRIDLLFSELFTSAQSEAGNKSSE